MNLQFETQVAELGLTQPLLVSIDANFNWTEKAENIKTMRSSSHRSSNRYTEYRIEYLILTLLANSSDFLERLSGPQGTSKLGKSEDKLILWKYFIRLPSEMYSSISTYKRNKMENNWSKG